jgi:hypothetical protein
VKKLFVVLMMAGVSMVCGVRANTQTAQESNPHVISNQDLDLLQKDIRSKKKQLVAANLRLTDTEVTKFWPIYDQYTAELITINDKKFEVSPAGSVSPASPMREPRSGHTATLLQDAFASAMLRGQ